MCKQPRSYNKLINELAELCGIVPEYWDIFGKKHITPHKTKKAILRAMKLNIDSVEDIVKEINNRKRRPWQNVTEPVHIKSVNDQPFTIPVYIPLNKAEEAELTISWSIEQEDTPESPLTPLFQRGAEGDHKGDPGEFSAKADIFTLSGNDLTVLEEQWIDDRRYIKAELSDTTQRDIGYYRIDIECRHSKHIFPKEKNIVQKRSRLIITPDTCYIPPELEKGRTWGFSVNLYAIRSSENWGIGDFSDLKRIVEWIGHLKGGFIGINPLHALPNTKPYGMSPYSPISRLFKNFIYLDVAHIPEVVDSEDIQKVITSERFSKALHNLRTADLIDYEKTASLKEKILRMAFDYFYEIHYTGDTERSREFKKYISEQGTSLESFATFMALYQHMKKLKNIYTWQEWDEKYHMLSNKAVQGFIKKHTREVLYHQYLQWLIDTQLEHVFHETKIQEMPVGLYYDLAIGSIGGGSDAWSFHDVIAVDADAGAPPDDFSPNGQNWGFPPLSPEKLRESAYELFIQTMRNNMKYGGALRIDHALGLFRLFWIPHGMVPKEGTYVSFPAEDLLRIIALESVRNKTVVIAEDLGTIGENMRETLERFHMLSYRLFYFERNYPDPSFSSPETYPALALCAITTHDLPTIYGYWAGQDLKVKQQLDMFPNEKLLRRQTKERERDKALMLSTLETQGILPHDIPSNPNIIAHMTQELCLSIYHYLALTPCKLLLVSLDDIIGTLNQQNMPGTLDEHPNWMQKTPLTLDELKKDRRFIDLSEMLRKTIHT
jgi:4-alpha-glucanotransferase